MTAATRPSVGASPAHRPHPRQPGPDRHGQVDAGPSLWTFILGLIVSLALVLSAFVYTQIQVNEAAVTRSEMRSQTAAESVRIENLRVEVATLDAPGRILGDAARMGLVTPAQVEFLAVRTR